MAKAVCRRRTAYVVPCRDALLDLLTPLSFPAVLATSAGHLLTAVDNLNPYWALYAPPSEEDPRRLLGDVSSALGLPEPAMGGTTIDGAYLATKVERFLSQYPMSNAFPLTHSIQGARAFSPTCSCICKRTNTFC